MSHGRMTNMEITDSQVKLKGQTIGFSKLCLCQQLSFQKNYKKYLASLLIRLNGKVKQLANLIAALGNIIYYMDKNCEIQYSSEVSLVPLCLENTSRNIQFDKSIQICIISSREDLILDFLRHNINIMGRANIIRIDIKLILIQV